MEALPDDMPENVARVIGSYPKAAQKQAMALRALILHTAAGQAKIGVLTEALKRSEPAYLTEATKSGTTVRYAWKAKAPNEIGVFFSCKTTLVATFENLFGDQLKLDGNRAIWFPLKEPLPKDILKLCFRQALTYKL